MIIEPKVKGFICTTAHPKGCEEHVKREISYTKSLGAINPGPKRALIIGASTGYGLASRITLAFGCHAATIGVAFEKPATASRTATPGYYNTLALEKAAAEEKLYASSLNGDAFSKELKEEVIARIRQDLGTVDCVIYSLAAPRRTTADGVTYTSSLKTTGEVFTEKSWNLKDNTISSASIAAAGPNELEGTIKVMGGEDWADWIEALEKAGVLAEQAVTVAYSYIGPTLTYPVYHDGTIGQAKRHLCQTAALLNQKWSSRGLRACISVNKALVTQASSAIPIVPLYFAILYRVMKAHGYHEGCIQQINRLFRDKQLCGTPVTDENGWIRLDDWELSAPIQKEVMEIWASIDSSNILQLADIDGYWEDFYHMFGFRFDNVDYTEDIPDWSRL